MEALFNKSQFRVKTNSPFPPEKESLAQEEKTETENLSFTLN